LPQERGTFILVLFEKFLLVIVIVNTFVFYSGHFDVPDRVFYSIPECFQSASESMVYDFKELIPQFFASGGGFYELFFVVICVYPVCYSY
jgi:hypothetical protein